LKSAIAAAHFADEEHKMAISNINTLAALLLILLSAAARAEPTLTVFGNATPQTAVVPDSSAVTLA